MTKEIVFRSDTSERKKWFKGLHFSHPAKMSLGLQIYLIEHYSKPGDVILDPMFGSGTLLVACAIGRHVIGLELEQKFVAMAEQNWEKVKSLGPILGYQMGTATIIQGDSRNLPEVLADVCCFSPPFSEQMQDVKWMQKNRPRKHHGTHDPKSQSPDNISNLKYGEIDKVMGQVNCICCSPPYEAAVTGKDGIDWSKGTRGEKEGYKPRDKSKEPAFEHSAIGGAGFRYSETKDNIGNLKGDSYLQSMLLVYQGCHRVLRDGGLMILVVKNFIRNKKEIRLDLDTLKLCEQSGFTLRERLIRRLTQRSFWRTLQINKCDHRKSKNACKLGLTCPTKEQAKTLFDMGLREKQLIEKLCPKYINTMPEIRFEDVLVFQKGE